jgi:tRNA-Thr(GGU) m(6)t(6)A37 methyltransferase TsaA
VPVHEQAGAARSDAVIIGRNCVTGPEHAMREDRMEYTLVPIGHIRSPLVDRAHAPKQGDEGAPDATLLFRPEVAEGLRGLHDGEEILVLTWLDRAERNTLSVHPRDDPDAPLRGVFSTRSQDRPNPVGLHRVRIVRVIGPVELLVAGLEAFDGTPIVDVKPVLGGVGER